MNPEAQEYYNIAGWLKDKVNYNRISKFNTNKRRQVLHGQIWYCDMGYNIGTEKNKLRPVLVMSNNRINNSEKVVIICITDAKGKVNANNLPAQDSWFLLYSAKVLCEHLNLFVDLSENAKTAEVMVEKEDDEKEKVLEMSIDELELSVRSYNCLKRAGINTVEELTNKTSEDMMKVRNLGRKSLEEVLAKLNELGLALNSGDE